MATIDIPPIDVPPIDIPTSDPIQSETATVEIVMEYEVLFKGILYNPRMIEGYGCVGGMHENDNGETEVDPPDSYEGIAFAGKPMTEGQHTFKVEVTSFSKAQSGGGLIGVANASAVQFGESDGLPEVCNHNKSIGAIGPHWGVDATGVAYKKPFIGGQMIGGIGGGDETAEQLGDMFGGGLPEVFYMVVDIGVSQPGRNELFIAKKWPPGEGYTFCATELPGSLVLCVSTQYKDDEVKISKML